MSRVSRATNSAGSDYRVEVDSVDEAEWNYIIQQFADATIYQTWAYGAVRWGAANLSHILLRRGSGVVAAAQVRIIKWPIVRGGIAYVASGPMWHHRKHDSTARNFQEMIRAVRNEYAIGRNLLVRLKVNCINDGDDTLTTILAQERFRWRHDIPPCRTLLVDLSESLDQLRGGLRRTWRQDLSKAERMGLQLVEGTSDDLFEKSLLVYKEMHRRKRFVEFVDMEEFVEIQRHLPGELRTRVILALYEQEIVGALAFSTIGDSGLPVLAATSDKGLQLKSSNMMWWRMIVNLKELEIKWCDLGGIDPEKNPGTYMFRSGLAGKNGKDVRFLGVFDACDSAVTSLLVDVGTRARAAYRDFRIALRCLHKRGEL